MRVIAAKKKKVSLAARGANGALLFFKEYPMLYLPLGVLLVFAALRWAGILSLAMEYME